MACGTRGSVMRRWYFWKGESMERMLELDPPLSLRETQLLQNIQVSDRVGHKRSETEQETARQYIHNMLATHTSSTKRLRNVVMATNKAILSIIKQNII